LFFVAVLWNYVVSFRNTLQFLEHKSRNMTTARDRL
jgi:hypothetical protein